MINSKNNSSNKNDNNCFSEYKSLYALAIKQVLQYKYVT